MMEEQIIVEVSERTTRKVEEVFLGIFLSVVYNLKLFVLRSLT